MHKHILIKVVLGVGVMVAFAGCASVSRVVGASVSRVTGGQSPEQLSCEGLRDEWRNIQDFDREETKRGTRKFGFGQIDSRRDDIRKAARAKRCKL